MDIKLDKVLTYGERLQPKITLPFDHMTNVRSHDNSENLYVHLHKTYDHC